MRFTPSAALPCGAGDTRETVAPANQNANIRFPCWGIGASWSGGSAERGESQGSKLKDDECASSFLCAGFQCEAALQLKSQDNEKIKVNKLKN